MLQILALEGSFVALYQSKAGLWDARMPLPKGWKEVIIHSGLLLALARVAFHTPLSGAPACFPPLKGPYSMGFFHCNPSGRSQLHTAITKFKSNCKTLRNLHILKGRDVIEVVHTNYVRHDLSDLPATHPKRKMCYLCSARLDTAEHTSNPIGGNHESDDPMKPCSHSGSKGRTTCLQ